MLKAVASAVLVGVATSAVAGDLKPAPDYFVEAMASITTAENIATACPNLTFNSAQAEAVSDRVLDRLSEDGFDPGNLQAGMASPADAVRSLQAAFLHKHGLAKDVQDFSAVCAAGLAEIAGETTIGGFLAEITGDGAVDPTSKSKPQ